MSKLCEILNQNDGDYEKTDPIIRTNILNTSKGNVVAQTTTYRSWNAESPKTKYGWLVKIILFENSQFAKRLPSPRDYKREFTPPDQIKISEVYVVEKLGNEKDKQNLAEILRLECGQYNRIYFF